VACLLVLISLPLRAQQTPAGDAPPAEKKSPVENKSQQKPSKNHIFWVIPNYREEENPADIRSLTARAKFKIAFDDSFDPSAFLVAGVFAGLSMAERQYAFGQGAQAFAKYYGGAFSDQAIGNMMTEAIFPVLLRQDPRYFTKGSGGFLKRTGYAISREVVTRGDDGRNHFNASELAGNAVAAGISTLYYPAVDRSFGNTTNKWAQQIALDTAFDIMKEFWPDVRRKLFGR
jgi:hypothetical protein